MRRQSSWMAGGMPAPPKAIVQEVQAKHMQVKKENIAATKVQAGVRAKNAKFEVEGKRQAKKEEGAATRIQAIKRGQQVRKDTASRRSGEGDGGEDEVYEEAPQNPLQKCTAGLQEWLHTVLDKCPCTSKAGEPHVLTEQEGLTHAMPKGAGGKLSTGLETKLCTLFAKMDVDKDNIISRKEAITYWGKNFAKINAQAMFNEVDADRGDSISLEEWLEFWRNVTAQDCYSQEDIVEEVDGMIAGGSWVDWNDGRTT